MTYEIEMIDKQQQHIGTTTIIEPQTLRKKKRIVTYRDKIYIVKDIILKLQEYGELTFTTLTEYCGLNMTKHRRLLHDLESKGLIVRKVVMDGRRLVTKYKVTEEGIEFYKYVLEPYENMIPRH